jgi:eukaryotic-like serine/threonine-protein kinase
VVDIVTGKADKKIDVATYVPGSPAVKIKWLTWAITTAGFSRSILLMKRHPGSGKMRVPLPFIASPAVMGNRLFTANHNKFLYSFEKGNGKKMWEYNTGNRVEASPVVAGNKVVVANMRGDLALVNAGDGKVIWTYEIGSQIISNPAVAGGRILLGHMMETCIVLESESLMRDVLKAYR